MKTVFITLEDHEHRALMKAKQARGLTWKELLLSTLKKGEEHQILHRAYNEAGAI